MSWWRRCVLPVVIVTLVLAGCVSRSSAEADPAPFQVKYVFLLIGDGYGPNQRYITEALLGRKLAMSEMSSTAFTGTDNFEGATTDSAASGTAIACGIKTYNGAIGLDCDGGTVESLACQLQRQGFKIAMLSSSPLTDATPAAHYSHQKHRGMHQEIGLDMANSGFDFFGGADVFAADAVLPLLAEHGYAVHRGPDALGRAEKGVKAYVNQAPYVPWDIFREDGLPEYTHAGYLAKAIELLDNPNGFFIMHENGHIDYSGHNNDAGKMIREVVAFDELVKVALAFQARHPEETLVVVTADHETGGLVIDDLQRELLPLLLKQKGPKEEIADRMRRLLETEAADDDAVVALLNEQFGCEFTPEEREMILSAGTASASGLVAAAARARDTRLGFSYTTGGHSSQKIVTNAQGPGSARFCEPLENADIPHLIRTIVLPGSEADFLADRREAMRLAAMRGDYTLHAPGLEVQLLPQEVRVCHIGNKAFDLSLPNYDRFVTAGAAAGADGYLVTVTNSDAFQPAYFALRLPDDAPDQFFFISDPSRKELYGQPWNSYPGREDRWSREEIGKFIGVCPARSSVMLQIGSEKPKDFLLVFPNLAVPPLDSRAILEARTVDAVPAIDGDLSDPAWEMAETYRFRATDGGKLTDPAMLRMVTDRDHSTLYLGLEIPDSGIVANFSDHDANLWEEDSIEIFLASSDQRNYHQIIVNPNGAVYDQNALSGKGWTADLETAGRYNESAGLWFLEIALPLDQFGLTAPLEGNVCRTDFPAGERSNLSPTNGDFHHRGSFLPIDLVE